MNLYLGCHSRRQSLDPSASGSKERRSEVAQSCPTPCDPVECGVQGSSVHVIFQTRVLEWVAISFSRGSSRTQGSNPGLPHWADALPSEPPGNPEDLRIVRSK